MPGAKKGQWGRWEKTREGVIPEADGTLEGAPARLTQGTSLWSSHSGAWLKTWVFLASGDLEQVTLSPAYAHGLTKHEHPQLPPRVVIESVTSHAAIVFC